MAEVKVKWGTRTFKGCDAQKVYLEICTIGEEVKPQQMVDYAEENPDSELHKCFTWDDNIAADKWRLEEARIIQRNLVIINIQTDSNKKKEPQIIRASYRTSTARDAGYKQTVNILRNEDDYAGMLIVAKAELRSFKNKYAILSELKPIFELIDEL